ncbi:MAG TPA: hypothetical protein PLO89_00525 [Spirochaetota bacterium]|nr:hypothetical protein [Spirochaetota bacterium]
MKIAYKVSPLKNPRYLSFIFLSLVIFCLALLVYYILENPLFLIIAILSIFTLSYFIVVLSSKLNHIVFLDEDRIAFQKTKSNIDVFYYRDIGRLGYYKKNLLEEKFSFGDGLYVYDEKKDNYVLIGVGFKEYLDLFKKIKEKSICYNLKWTDIKRDKGVVLVEELQKMLNEK